ncbi:MAG: hypothetical protein ABSG44_21395 [Thermodesulfobacteriota bacterium]|jgi:hypothetical protein
MKYVRLSLIVLALLLIFTGCAKPPDAERRAAKAAMDTAASAGADKYASSDLDTGTRIWDTAESQMKEKKYKEAKESYIDAKGAFEKANAAAEAGKKAVADEANAAMAALEESWEHLKATAGRLGKKMKGKREGWMADTNTISGGLAKAKEMIPTDPLGAKAKLEELKAIVDKWEDTFKTMAATPKKPEAVKKKAVKKKAVNKKAAKKGEK